MPKVIEPSMSSKLAWLKTLKTSQRSCTPRVSPNLKFLNMAMSLLKMEGILTLFRGMVPIWPRPVGLVKHPTLITYADPVESKPDAPLAGSQVVFGRAFTVPPVKSVSIVQTVADVRTDPAGQDWPAVIVAVPLVKLTVRFFARPVAYEVVPDNCQSSKIALTTPLSLNFRLSFGMS